MKLISGFLIFSTKQPDLGINLGIVYKWLCLNWGICQHDPKFQFENGEGGGRLHYNCSKL